MMRCLLIGNPNTGKSTLFNLLTNGRQRVGNWHGKTVECASGICRACGHEMHIIDLPGTYSLSPFSDDEREVLAAIGRGGYDAVIQVADACHMERSLLLTLGLLRMTPRVVVAVNKTDAAKDKGISLSFGKLGKAFGAEFIPISAKKGEGIAELLCAAAKASKRKGDAAIGKKRSGAAAQSGGKGKKMLGGAQEGAALGTDAIRKDYLFIEDAARAAIKREKPQGRGMGVDRLLLNPYIGIPLFLFVMLALFQATFSLSAPVGGLLEEAFSLAGQAATGAASAIGAPQWVQSLISDGIIAGVGSVLIFAPAIFILFFLLHALEDTGYVARVSVLMDGIMGRAGLSGKAFIPLALGFGCNVPAVMATRILGSKKERLSAMAAIPFMSCAARLPVLTIFAGAFFAGSQGLVLLLLYVFGIACGVLTSFVYGKAVLRAPKPELAIELPDYQFPSFRTVFSQARVETQSFIARAGTIILACSVLVWFLASMPYGVEYGSQESYAGSLGSAIAPAFAPLGFGNWQASISLMFGFVAKEVVVSSLSTAYASPDDGLQSVLSAHFTPLSAASFMVFVLLYVPCLATVAVMKKESGSTAFAAGAAIYYTAFAWLASFAIYSAGLALGFG